MKACSTAAAAGPRPAVSPVAEVRHGAVDMAQLGTFVIAGDQTWQDAFDIADRCTAEWDAFLRDHGLQPKALRRQPPRARQQAAAARKGPRDPTRRRAQYLRPPPFCPVCGGPTGPDFTARYEDRVYEFCSEACKAAFEARAARVSVGARRPRWAVPGPGATLPAWG
jgi:YHS domain-containing protein